MPLPPNMGYLRIILCVFSIIQVTLSQAQSANQLFEIDTVIKIVDSQTDEPTGTAAVEDVTVDQTTGAVNPEGTADPGMVGTGGDMTAVQPAVTPPANPFVTPPSNGGVRPSGKDTNDLTGATTSCNKDDALSCNITNLERCVLIRERAPRCVCLGGYSRGADGYTCVAVKTFQGSLKTYNAYSSKLTDSSSMEYRKLEFQAREGLFAAIQESKLRTIANDIKIVGFEEDTDGNVIINYDILVSRTYAPAVSMVNADFREGISRVLESAADGTMVLVGTDIVLQQASIDGISISDPDPCTDPLMNYCDENALCTRTSRSFVCTCRDGFQDASINKLEAPGERCLAECRCKNDGECLVNSQGALYCKCPSWFLGTRCEVDGEVLLIVVCSVLGALFIIGIVIGACYLGKVRRLRRELADDDSIEEISRRSGSDRRGYKIARRPWMDDWKYYTYSHMPYPQLLGYWNRVPTPADMGYTNRALPMSPFVSNIPPMYQSYTIPRVHPYAIRAGPAPLPAVAGSVYSQPLASPPIMRQQQQENGKWHWESDS